MGKIVWKQGDHTSASEGDVIVDSAAANSTDFVCNMPQDFHLTTTSSTGPPTVLPFPSSVTMMVDPQPVASAVPDSTQTCSSKIQESAPNLPVPSTSTQMHMYWFDIAVQGGTKYAVGRTNEEIAIVDKAKCKPRQMATDSNSVKKTATRHRRGGHGSKLKASSAVPSGNC